MAQTSLPAIADLIDGATPSANTQTQAKSFFTGLRAWAAAWLNLGGTHTAGYVLTNTGSGSDPTWQAPATGGASHFFSGGSNSGTDITGDGTVFTPSLTEIFDTGSAFDGSLAKFTAPSTGYYQFNANVTYLNAEASTFTFTLYVDLSSGTDMQITKVNAATRDVMSLSFIAYLTSGATAILQFYASGGSKTVDIDYIHFSGCKLG